MLTVLTQTPPFFGGSPQVAIAIYSQWLGRLGWGAQILREECERSAPGEVGGRFIVTRGTGVVIEGVLCARINVDREFLVVGLECCLISSDALVDVLVVFGVVQQKRRLDRRHHL